MTDHELVAVAYAIQLARGWSVSQTARVAHVGRTAWQSLVYSRTGLMKLKTRVALETFVEVWADYLRPNPVTGSKSLITSATAIQSRRGWTNATCSELSGIPWSTWQQLTRADATFTRPHVRAKLQAFVDAWEDDSRIGPAPKKWRGLNFKRARAA